MHYPFQNFEPKVPPGRYCAVWTSSEPKDVFRPRWTHITPYSYMGKLNVFALITFFAMKKPKGHKRFIELINGHAVSECLNCKDREWNLSDDPEFKADTHLGDPGARYPERISFAKNNQESLDLVCSERWTSFLLLFAKLTKRTIRKSRVFGQTNPSYLNNWSPNNATTSIYHKATF